MEYVGSCAKSKQPSLSLRQKRQNADCHTRDSPAATSAAPAKTRRHSNIFVISSFFFLRNFFAAHSLKSLSSLYNEVQVKTPIRDQKNIAA